MQNTCRRQYLVIGFITKHDLELESALRFRNLGVGVTFFHGKINIWTTKLGTCMVDLIKPKCQLEARIGA